MRGVNKVTLLGHLGKEVETRYFPNGDAVANVSVATSESWTDKASGEKKEHTEWHNVVFRRKLAEIADQYLKKGSKVYIEGFLRTRKWQDKDTGKDRFTTEVIVDEMRLLDSKPADGATTGGYQKRERPASNTAPAAQNEHRSSGPDHGFEDDDIPF